MDGASSMGYAGGRDQRLPERAKGPPEPCAQVRILPGALRDYQGDQSPGQRKCHVWRAGFSPTVRPFVVAVYCSR